MSGILSAPDWLNTVTEIVPVLRLHLIKQSKIISEIRQDPTTLEHKTEYQEVHK